GADRLADGMAALEDDGVQPAASRHSGRGQPCRAAADDGDVHISRHDWKSLRPNQSPTACRPGGTANRALEVWVMYSLRASLDPSLVCNGTNWLWAFFWNA